MKLYLKKAFEPVIPELTRRGPERRISDMLWLTIRLTAGLTTTFAFETLPLPDAGHIPFEMTAVVDFKISSDKFVDFATTFIFTYYARKY